MIHQIFMVVFMHFNPFSSIGIVFKFQFTGQCPVTMRAWQAGNIRYTIGPTRIVPAVQISVCGDAPTGNACPVRQVSLPDYFCLVTFLMCKFQFIAPFSKQ